MKFQYFSINKDEKDVNVVSGSRRLKMTKLSLKFWRVQPLRRAEMWLDTVQKVHQNRARYYTEIKQRDINTLITADQYLYQTNICSRITTKNGKNKVFRTVALGRHVMADGMFRHLPV